jgi:hypothetical protein
MKSSFFSGVIGLVLLLILGNDGLPQGKEKKKEEESSKPTLMEYKQIQQAKELEGKLGGIASALLTLQLNIPRYEPNPKFNPPKTANNYLIRMREVHLDYMRLMNSKNPLQYQRRLAELAAEMNRLQALVAKANVTSPFKAVPHFKDFELPVSEKVVVRKFNLGMEYDNEGNIIQRSKEEIAKLRGKDPKVPGYAAKLDDLKPGQTVHLYLTPPSKKEDEGVGNIARPTVRMIVIMQDVSNLATSTGNPKKKN